MNDDNYAKAYAEVLHLLKGFDKKDVEKIPTDLIEYFRNNAKKEYKCDFDYTKKIDDLNLRDETYGIISMICYKYWCDTEEEKEEYLEKIKENENVYKEYMRDNALGTDSLFNNSNNSFVSYENNREKNDALITKTKEKWYERIITFFKSIIKQ